MAVWPSDNGGVSPLVGSANLRLSEALMNTIRDALGPESYTRISSHPAGAYDRLLPDRCRDGVRREGCQKSIQRRFGRCS